jgi:hypothetical protein
MRQINVCRLGGDSPKGVIGSVLGTVCSWTAVRPVYQDDCGQFTSKGGERIDGVDGGGVAGQGAVADRQRAEFVEDPAAVEGGGVAGQGGVADRQRAIVVEDAAAGPAGNPSSLSDAVAQLSPPLSASPFAHLSSLRYQQWR